MKNIPRALVLLFVSTLTASGISGLPGPASGQDGYRFRKVVGEWDISAEKAAPPADASDVTLTDARGRQRPLNRQFAGIVEDVVAFETSRLVFVLNGNRLAVVNPSAATILDEFFAVHTSFSPTHRFMAFTAFVPRWAEASELYLVYDLTLSAEQNCMTPRCDGFQGVAVYPDENRRGRSYDVPFFDATHDNAPRPPEAVRDAMHRLSSDLVWIGDTRFAFLDCSRKSSQVVLVDVQRGVGSARTASAMLDLAAVLDPAKLPVQETPIDGREWLLAESIEPQEMSGGNARLRVWLQWHPYMKVTDVTVSLYPR